MIDSQYSIIDSKLNQKNMTIEKQRMSMETDLIAKINDTQRMTCSGDAFWTSGQKKIKRLKVDSESVEGEFGGGFGSKSRERESMNGSAGFGDWNKVCPIEE